MNSENKIDIFALTDSHQEVRKMCNLFSYVAQHGEKPAKNTIICDCGDLFKGIYDKQLCVKSYLKFRTLLPDAEIVMALGNNDFGFNADNFKFMQSAVADFKQANIKVLCGNLYDVNTKKCPHWIEPYTVLEMESKKIFVTAFCLNLLPLEKYGVYLSDIPSAFLQTLKIIKRLKPDAVIVLNHALKEYSNALVAKAQQMDVNIDLVIGGHEHTIIEPDNQRKIYYPQAFSKSMLQFEMRFLSDSTELRFVKEIFSKGLPLCKIFADDIEKYENESGLNTPVAKSVLNLEKRYADPCSLGTFIADKMQEEAHADFGVISTGFISHALRYEQDKILTNYNLERAISAKVVLQIMHLKICDIKEVFNHALRNHYIYHVGNNSFLQCSKNVTIVCYKNKDNLGRVRQIYINDEPILDANEKPLDTEKSYACAIDPFVAAGELGFDVLRPISKQTWLQNNQPVRIKDLFAKGIKEAPQKYAAGTQYPQFKLIDETA